MCSLAHVLASPRKASRQSRPRSLRVPPLTLRLVTWQRMSFSEPLVCSAISGRSSAISSSALLACRRTSNRSSMANPVRRMKMRSKRAQLRTAARGRIGAIGLEVAIEPPDQPADVGLRALMQVGERVQLVHQAFGMDPAQGVAPDVELPGIVADDDRL